jgi:hypothetical protein
VGHPSPSEAICAGGVAGVDAATQTRGSAGRWKRWRADPCCASHALPAGCAAEGKHGRRRELLRAAGAPWADIVIVTAVHKVGRRRTRLRARARQAASGASPFTHDNMPSAASLLAPSQRAHRSVARAARVVVLLPARGPQEGSPARRQGRAADARRNHSAPFRPPREPARCARLGSHDMLRARYSANGLEGLASQLALTCCPVPAASLLGPRSAVARPRAAGSCGRRRCHRWARLAPPGRVSSRRARLCLAHCCGSRPVSSRSSCGHGPGT